MVLVDGEQETEPQWICLEKNKEINNTSNPCLDVFSVFPGKFNSGSVSSSPSTSTIFVSFRQISFWFRFLVTVNKYYQSLCHYWTLLAFMVVCLFIISKWYPLTDYSAILVNGVSSDESRFSSFITPKAGYAIQTNLTVFLYFLLVVLEVWWTVTSRAMECKNSWT